MKINEDLYAAVDDHGNIKGNPETEAIGSKSSVMMVIDSWLPLKNDLIKGKLKIIKVRIVPVEDIIL